MKKIFITGSTDGLGFMAAEGLIKQGNQVILHARNQNKADAVRKRLPKAIDVVIGDLSIMDQTVELAEQVNSLGAVDSIIHNAGVGFREPFQKTKDGFPHVLMINSLAPYILTCLIKKPKRLINTSSGMQEQGDASLKDLLWETKNWNSAQAYSDTKLHDILLAFAVARYWPDGKLQCSISGMGSQ